MWLLLLSTAWAASLSEVAAEAVALQRGRGEPVLVALPDAATEAAWRREQLPADVLIIPTVSADAAQAFQAVQGVECGLLVSGDGPEAYVAEPIGACGPETAADDTFVPGPAPLGWESTHNWTAVGVSASTLVLAPKLHVRVPSDFGMLGLTGGFSWWGPRVSVQHSTSPRQGGSGAYLGGEAMLRTIHTMTVSGAQETIESSGTLIERWGQWGVLFPADNDPIPNEEELYRTAFGVGMAPIAGYQYISEGGLFLSAQAGPQLLLLLGDDWVWPVQLRASGQVLVGFVPKRWRGRDPDAR